jgi:opacity protein-like surface antigen
MKKTLFALGLLLVIVVSTASAQMYPRRPVYWRQEFAKEFYVAYGLQPVQVAFETHANNFGNAAADPANTYRIQRSTLIGPIIAGFNHYVSEEWSIGVQASVASFDTQYQYTASFTTLKADMRYYSLMPRTDYRWIARRSFQLYSSAAIGPSIGTARFEDGSTETKVLFAFQVNPIGIRVGRGLGVFAEAGVGNNGLFTFGVSQKW